MQTQYVIIVVLLLVVLYLFSVERGGENFTHVIATPTSRPLPVILPAELTAASTAPPIVVSALKQYLTKRANVSNLKAKLGQIETLQATLRGAANNDYNAALQEEMKRANDVWKDTFRALGAAIAEYNKSAADLDVAQSAARITIMTR